MGSSFEDKSDEEFESNGAFNNNNVNKVKDENFPLVPRK